MLRFIIFSLLLLCPFLTLEAQTGTAFGIKGGLTLGNQNWNGSERELLPAYHGALTMESVNDSISLSFFGQVGYHVKGSAIRFRGYQHPVTLQWIPGRTERYPFTQVSVVGGLKNRHEVGMFDAFYYLGIRVDYLLDYQVLNAHANNSGFDQYVNKVTYGVNIGGGIEYEFSNFPAAIFLDLSFQPDLGRQIFLPGGQVFYIDRFTNQQIAYPEQKVLNRTIELALGVKFIRRVEWVDEWDDESLLKMHRSVAKR